MATEGESALPPPDQSALPPADRTSRKSRNSQDPAAQIPDAERAVRKARESKDPAAKARPSTEGADKPDKPVGMTGNEPGGTASPKSSARSLTPSQIAGA